VVGGVASLAAGFHKPVLVIAGDIYDDVDSGLDVISLVARVGAARAFADPLGVIRELVYERVRG
jgi:glycerate kinase